MANHNYNMYHEYGSMGYPIYNNSVWDGYHYAFGSNMDPHNLSLAGGASTWSYDSEFAHNRNGTGVFIPKLDHGTGVFHPNLELLGNQQESTVVTPTSVIPNRVARQSNVVTPNSVDQERNRVIPNRVAQESNVVTPNRIGQESNREIPSRVARKNNVVTPNRVAQESNRVIPNRVARESNAVIANRVDRESDVFCIDALPDELQGQVLSFLPLACAVGASCVCKKWKNIVHSEKFKMNNNGISSKKPWYFMFTNSDQPMGKIYDPVQRHWYGFEFPFNMKHPWKIAASSGLLCLMQENGCNFEIDICNPMTRKHRIFEERLGAQESIYSNLAFSVDEPSKEYTIAIVRSWHVQGSLSLWNTSVHIYKSEQMSWLPSFVENLSGWRAENDTIIFNGVLYFVVTRLGMTNCHALLSYDPSSSSSNCSLIETLIPIPFSLTCVRLMNLHNKIVMVGGLGSHDVPEKIGIWMLKGTEWQEVSWVPDNCIQGFKELDDVFVSCGAGDLIYIQAYGSAALLVFDMRLKAWRWCQKCPWPKKYSLQLFSGFCFEPRLDISP